MTLLDQDLWLSEMLGKPAFRFNGKGSDAVATDFPKAESFIEARVDVSDSASLAQLQSVGFHVIDCNMTFELPLDTALATIKPSVNSSTIRFATNDDEWGVRALARKSFEYNRFRRDPRIPNDLADEIKEEWASNFFAGARGEWMVVAEEGAEIVGFLQLMRVDNDMLLIDLIGVAPQMQRNGIARLMVSFAFWNCMNQANGMRVGTQLSNRAAMHFYESMGFKVRNVVYVLHMHQGV